mmetsp:Transcript_24857/g.76855  ORF Transcript_24857/g.76855 Transcript_24857/m.76855 type:complete len:91 (-) Transcript_24857:179-451(-)
MGSLASDVRQTHSAGGGGGGGGVDAEALRLAAFPRAAAASVVAAKAGPAACRRLARACSRATALRDGARSGAGWPPRWMFRSGKDGIAAS